MTWCAALVGAFVFLGVTGCRTSSVSSTGGVVTLDEKFSMTVPATMTLKQNAEAPLNIMLNRGADFKRDVQLEVNVEGISVSPSSVLVKASDLPEVRLQVAAARESALGDYRVMVKATPETGKAASAVVVVKVVPQ